MTKDFVLDLIRSPHSISRCKNAIIDDLSIATIDRYFSIRSPSVVSRKRDEDAERLKRSF